MGGGTTAYSSESASASIAVTAIDDDAPVEVANTGSMVAEGGTDTLSRSELEFTDTEQPATSVTYTVTGSGEVSTYELVVGKSGKSATLTPYKQGKRDHMHQLYFTPAPSK